MVKIAICDDDEVFLQNFSEKVKTEFSARKIETEIIIVSDETKLFYEVIDFDVLFLDIDMPQIQGYKIADKANKTLYQPIIVFVSGHDDFVYDCFEFKAFWFLRKSKLDKSDDLVKSIEAIIRKIDLKNETLRFHLNNGTDISIKIIDIIYFEINKNLIDIHKKDEVFQAYVSLKKYERLLSDKFFARCNKNCLLNLRHITDVNFEGNYKWVKVGETQFIVTKYRIALLKQKYFDWLSQK